MNKRLGKFEVTQVANGFTLGLINRNYQPGMKSGDGDGYYSTLYIASTPQELAEIMVAHLVTERMEGAV